MNEKQILNSVISGIMEIPLPKDGKTVGAGKYLNEIRETYRLARMVQFADNVKEMREGYSQFRKYVDACR
jgi:hypothetical protein